MYNLDRVMGLKELNTFDTIHFCGGSETHLMKAINRINFGPTLKTAVNNGLFYIGVSAGSMIASSSVKNSLRFIPNPLEPHCEDNVTPNGPLLDKDVPINLSDNQAVWITDDSVTIV